MSDAGEEAKRRSWEKKAIAVLVQVSVGTNEYFFHLLNLVCSPFEWPQGQVHCYIPHELSLMQTEQWERESSTWSVEGLYQ